MKGGCFTDPPKKLQAKKCLINLKNPDKHCFKWAFLAGCHHSQIKNRNSARLANYKKYENLYDFKSVGELTDLRMISKFEECNYKSKIAINIFGYDKEDVGLHILQISANSKNDDCKIINLLYYKDHENSPGHFFTIVNIQRLIGRKGRKQKKVCYNCLNLITKKSWSIHKRLCYSSSPQISLLPGSKNIKPFLKFEKNQNKLKVPFVFYADFECLGQNITEELPTSESYTQLLKKHVPTGFSISIVNSVQEKLMSKIVYRGKDCVDVFFDKLEYLSVKFLKKLQKIKPMNQLTVEQKRKFESAVKCHICEENIQNDEKVYDHDHLTGEFRGAAHSSCNLNFKHRNKIPVLFHNFKNYDSHIIIQGFHRYNGKIDVIPTNSEKYISIICENFLFLDSMMFLNASLETLVENLKDKKEFSQVFKYLVDAYGGKKAKLFSRKGVYCYDYVDSFKRFSECELPSIDKFYNVLNNQKISLDDYDYANQIFNSFCMTFGDYHDLYLQVDSLLLACVFENFRKIAMECYDLDPLYYFSLAGYAWDVSLKFSGVNLELITDIDMYNMIELSMRGGVSMITHRKENANNTYMNNFSKEQAQSFLFYIDKNNLYGEALSQSLPYAGFKWVTASEFTSFNILELEDDSKYGYIFEVDLEYPSHLHDSHNDYPLAADKVSIKFDQLSPFQKTLIEELEISYNENQKKLIPHLGKRKNYVVHYRNLKYYLRSGLILTNIHRVLKFRQKSWMKEYILFNTMKRQEAANEFEKDFFKYMCNAVFGKSIENVRNRKNVYIVSKESKAKKLANKVNFSTFDILNKNLAVIALKSKQLY